MDKFAFIVHPISVEQFLQVLGKFGYVARKFPRSAIKKIIKSIPPYSFLFFERIQSATKKEISGYVILCPFLPEHIAVDEKLVLEKILVACRIAQKLGVKIVGLGGFSSIVGEGGNILAEKLNIAVTSGNTFTACLVIDGIMKAVELFKKDIREASVAIIGATGDIGSICTEILSKYASRIVLAARNERKLEEFASKIRENSFATIIVEKYVKDAVKNADIILTATSALTTIIEPEDLNSGSILCDVSYPANINLELASKRKDIFVFEGGLVETGCLSNIEQKGQRRLELFNPRRNIIHGCFAETMLLTFEEKFENFSIGRGNITLNKINEIRNIGIKHGFTVAQFLCGNKIMKDSDVINKIKS